MTAPAKAVLVTGGAVRLGRAIVAEFARAGWRPAFTYRSSAAPAAAFAAQLRAGGTPALAIAADLDDQRARVLVAERVQEEFGGLDALVNSAGVFPRTPFADLTPTLLADVLRTNLEAPLFLTQACAPSLRARRGAVVNIADLYGLFPLRHHLAYSVSKAALIAATRALAVEMAPEVRVNAVAPGIAVFPEGYDAAARERILAKTLLHREGGAAEIARTVRFLVEGVDTVTGQVVTVDGGRSVAL
ncbi:MAG: SDR family oxidoreductase [Thermoanaerobaculaceae bacterium]|nr:SDR family oxidoreductase [Thermoanaerobaculaceae bacterium]